MSDTWGALVTPVQRCSETRAHNAHEWYDPLRHQCPGGPDERAQHYKTRAEAAEARAKDFEGRYETSHDSRMHAERCYERAAAKVARVEALAGGPTGESGIRPYAADLQGNGTVEFVVRLDDLRAALKGDDDD